MSRQSLAAVLEMPPAAAPTLLPPRPAEPFGDGQLSGVVQGHLCAQKAPDGGWNVTVPYDGTAQVTAVNSTRGAVWSVLNVPGTNDQPLKGQSIQLPMSVRPGDKLVLMSSSDGGSDRPLLGYAQGGAVDEAMVISFVAYDTREEVVGKLLRGPAWGRRGNPWVDFLANNPWPEPDWSRLPSVIDLDELYLIPGQPRPGDDQRIDPTAWGAARPNIADSIAIHRYFPMDLYSGWNVYGDRVASTAHQQYGTFYLAHTGLALALCCSTLPLEEKKPLVRALMQRAIDDLAGMADGSFRYALGGHCWGRRGLLVLLGHMYGFDPFAEPNTVFGNRSFPEDQLVTVTSFWGQPNWTGYLYSTSSQNPSDPNLWARHPSTWGDRNTSGTEAWQVCYGEQVMPAMLLTATAICVMGREHQAPKLVNGARSWFNGPPEPIRAMMWALGVNLHFGIDYAVPAGLGVAAWKRYGTP